MPTVGPDDQLCSDVRRLGSLAVEGDADDLVSLTQQAGGAASHKQGEARDFLALGGEEIKEVPLRHEGDVAASQWQAAEIGDRHLLASHLGMEIGRLLVRQLQEFI